MKITKIIKPLALITIFAIATGCSSNGGGSGGGNSNAGTTGSGDGNGGPTDGSSAQGQPAGPIDQALLGEWFVGNATGGYYDTVTGRYLGASGVGSIHNYAADGTCWWYYLMKIGSAGTTQFGHGNYTAESGVIRITNGIVEDGDESGQNIKPKRHVPDSVIYYVIEPDEDGGTIMYSSFSYPSPKDDPDVARSQRP